MFVRGRGLTCVCRFCFYTGTVPHTDALVRSHSASSVEALLASPVLGCQLSPLGTPTRSSSLEHLASGASTPTPRHARAPEAVFAY